MSNPSISLKFKSSNQFATLSRTAQHNEGTMDGKAKKNCSLEAAASLTSFAFWQRACCRGSLFRELDLYHLGIVYSQNGGSQLQWEWFSLASYSREGKNWLSSQGLDVLPLCKYHSPQGPDCNLLYLGVVELHRIVNQTSFLAC